MGLIWRAWQHHRRVLTFGDKSIQFSYKKVTRSILQITIWKHLEIKNPSTLVVYSNFNVPYIWEALDAWVEARM